MAKTRKLSLPHDVYVAVMRRIFRWTPKARAALQREVDRLQCAQFGHTLRLTTSAGRFEAARCARCGQEQAHG